jgi:hypothetical protein
MADHPDTCPACSAALPDSIHGYGTINPTGLRAYECATCPTCDTELRRALTGVDDEHVEALRLRPLDEPHHSPVRLTLTADHRPFLRLVVVEFERAEGGAAGRDGGVCRHLATRAPSLRGIGAPRR